MFDSPDGFADALGVTLPDLVQHNSRYYVVPDKLQPWVDKLPRRLRSPGLRVGTSTEGFTPTPRLVKMVADEANSVALDRSGSEEFCYGNTVSTSHVTTANDDAYVFVFDNHGLCIGLGYYDETLEPVVDLGLYLRERR